LNDKYRAGEAIPIAEEDSGGSLRLWMGGYLSVPVMSQSGVCNDFNPVGYMNPISSLSCDRKAVTSSGSCTDDVFRNLDLETIRIGKSPESLGLMLSQSYVSITVTNLCMYNVSSQSEYSCTSSPSLPLPQTTDLGSGQGCSNVLRELDLSISTDGMGGIESVNANVVIYDQIDASSSSEDVFVTQT